MMSLSTGEIHNGLLFEKPIANCSKSSLKLGVDIKIFQDKVAAICLELKF